MKMQKQNKYEIILKYNNPEYIHADSKAEARYDFKERNQDILTGKGCDKIVEVKLVKTYTDKEWQTLIDKRKKETKEWLRWFKNENE